MMRKPVTEDIIISEVTKRTPEASNHRIVNLQKKFLNGSLYTVAFDGNPIAETGVVPSYQNRVYVHGGSIDVFGHDEALLNIVGATHKSGPFEMFGDTKIVSGIIALIMTLLIISFVTVGLYRDTATPIPELLSSGWLIILGFYFGKLDSKE